MAARLRQGDDWQIPGILDRLKEMRDRGDSFGLIAEVLSREFGARLSRNACLGKSHRMWGKLATAPKVTKPRGSAARPSVQRARATAYHAVHRINTPKPQLGPERVADAAPLQIGLQDLTQTACRYPYGDGPLFLFCGCEVVTGPYCVPHAALCFNENQGERRAESEARKRAYMRSQRAA